MNSDDLDADQAQKLVDAIRRQLRYLNRLSARMQALQFRPDDPLLRAAVKARDAKGPPIMRRAKAEWAGQRAGRTAMTVTGDGAPGQEGQSSTAWTT